MGLKNNLLHLYLYKKFGETDSNAIVNLSRFLNNQLTCHFNLSTKRLLRTKFSELKNNMDSPVIAFIHTSVRTQI